MIGRFTPSVAGVLLALVSVGAGASAAEAEAPTRAEYVRAVEPICFKDARRNARILRGTRQMVDRGQYRAASARFARAARAFTATLRRVIRVPRPEADRAMLQQWFVHLRRQRTYLIQISRHLGKGDRLQSQRLSLRLIRNAQQANFAVAGMGFRHCQIRPGMFL